MRLFRSWVTAVMGKEVRDFFCSELSLTFLCFYSSAENDSFSDTFFSATAVGSNNLIGEHIREETNHWYDSVMDAIVQYNKIDIGKEDLENKKEILLQLSENYN